MSLATLKRKTEERYKTASAQRSAYSINGSFRAEGYGPNATQINNTNAPSVVNNINRKFHNNANYNHFKSDVLTQSSNPHNNHFKSSEIGQSQSSRLEKLKKQIPFKTVMSTHPVTNNNTNNHSRNTCSTTKTVSIMSYSEYLQKRAFKNKKPNTV